MKRSTIEQSLSGYIRFSLLVLCGFVSLLAPAFAQPSSLSSPHQGRLAPLLEEIGLDEKTLTEVRKILDASKTDHQELHRKLHEAFAHMRALLEQEEPNEAAVMAQAEVIGELRTEARKQRLRTLIQVRALLAPEQRAKLFALMRPDIQVTRAGRSHLPSADSQIPKILQSVVVPSLHIKYEFTYRARNVSVGAYSYTPLQGRNCTTTGLFTGWTEHYGNGNLPNNQSMCKPHGAEANQVRTSV